MEETSMKKLFSTRKIAALSMGILTLFLLNSCVLLLEGMTHQNNRVLVESDRIRNIDRVRLNLHHNRSVERRTPFISVSQHFLREFRGDGTNNFTVYETLRLSQRSFPVEPTIFLMIDNRHFEISVRVLTVDRIQETTPTTDRVLTSDSVFVRVVTGVHESLFWESRLTYTLNSQILNAILGASRLQFRYYSGPYMITTRLSGGELRRLKRMIRTLPGA